MAMSREELIRQIYQEELGREADAAGLQYWLTSNASPEQLRNYIKAAAAPEQQPMGREELIRQIYRDQLGRDEVDAPGLNYWMNSALPDDKLAGAIGFAARQPTVDETARPATNNYSAELLQDPGYSQFLRGAAYDESAIQSAYIAAQDAINRRIEAQRWGYDDQRKQTDTNIARGFANRGMYGAGRQQKDLSDANIRSRYQQGMNEASQTDRLSQMATDAATRVSGLRRQQGEANLDTRMSLTQGSLLV